MPFTKRLDSSVENSLAMSTASLMLTTGGMSVRRMSSKMATRRMARSTRAMRPKAQFLAYLPMISSMRARSRMTPWTSSSAKA